MAGPTRHGRLHLGRQHVLPARLPTRSVTASRTRASATSPPSCLPASASTIAALVRGPPSASSPRTSGATRSIMAFSSAVPVMAGVLVRGM